VLFPSLSGAGEISRLPMPSFSLFLSTDNQYIMEFLLDFILHIDQYMIDIVQEYHMWAYVILFLLIVVIIMISILPAVVEVLRARLKQ
jgi:membrane-associated protein